jgi:hypothetical protein
LKITDQKGQLRSSVQRLHTPAEQLRFSSVRPNLKPQPLEYPDESEEVQPSPFTAQSQIISADADVASHQPNTGKRPLAVVIAWLGARPKHIEKYSQIWIDRGFDVISESIDPADLLLPKQRAIPRVNRLVQTLYDLTTSGKHDEIVMHCFSVGGYIFGEMLHQLIDDDLRKEIQGDNPIDPRAALQNTIKGKQVLRQNF